MSLECIWCQDWKPQIKKVERPIVLQSIRAGRDLFDGKPFRFCPWCGHELHEVAPPPQSEPTK